MKNILTIHWNNKISSQQAQFFAMLMLALATNYISFITELKVGQYLVAQIWLSCVLNKNSFNVTLIVRAVKSKLNGQHRFE